MTLKEKQDEIDAWINQHKAGYWKPHEILGRIMEETGELAREINHVYGPKPKKEGEKTNDLTGELGDVLFSLCCMANSMDINLDESFRMAMDKCYGRDAERFEKR